MSNSRLLAPALLGSSSRAPRWTPSNRSTGRAYYAIDVNRARREGLFPYKEHESTKRKLGRDVNVADVELPMRNNEEASFRSEEEDVLKGIACLSPCSH